MAVGPFLWQGDRALLCVEACEGLGGGMLRAVLKVRKQDRVALSASDHFLTPRPTVWLCVARMTTGPALSLFLFFVLPPRQH